MSLNQQHFQCIQCGEILPGKHQHNNHPVCLACAKETGLFDMVSPLPAPRKAPKTPTPIAPKPRTAQIKKSAPPKKHSLSGDSQNIVGYSLIGYLLAAWVVLSVIIIFAGMLSGGEEIKAIPNLSLDAENWLERGNILAAGSEQIREFNTIAQSAQEGNPEAQYWLGCYFFENAQKISDFQISAQLLQRAAEQGSAAAQYNLALLYYRGMGIEHDVHTAKEWFIKAAGQNHLAAQRNLELITNQSNEL